MADSDIAGQDITQEDDLVSQDDIDKLLEASNIDNDASEGQNDGGAEELGELSQDDIDRLLNSASAETEDSSGADEGSSDDQDDDLELISQDDIDQLMGLDQADNSGEPDDNGETGEDAVPDEELDEDAAMILQDDLTSLVADQADTPSAREEETPAREEKPEDDYVIDESQAVDVQDCLVTQDALDELVSNFDNADVSESEPEPVVLDEIDDSEGAGSGADEEPESSDSSGVTVLDFESDDEVTQDDIDSLLLESDDDLEDGEEDEDEDLLISQDDIDTLLMAADQEDEDVLGDLMDDDIEDILEGEQENAEDAPGTDGDIEGGADKVVLEDDDLPEDSAQDKSGIKSGWYRSKLVIAGISAIVVLGITIPAAYFLFFSGTPEQAAPVQDDSFALPAQDSGENMDIQTVSIDIQSQPVAMKKSGILVLKNFIVLTPDTGNDLTYITADISIDYSDERAVNEIEGNLSFYRGIIYDALRKTLALKNQDKIVQSDLLFIIENKLKKALPGPYIDRVSFKSFKAS
jgi:pilus assembly protein FimV